jgi:hypothetical protein
LYNRDTMKQPWKKLQGIIWHPFLFGLFVILSLLSANLQRLPASHILRPLLVLLFFTTLLFYLLVWLVKDRHPAGVILSLALFLFFSYGHVYGLLEGTSMLGFDIGRHRVLLPLFLLLFLGGAWSIFKNRPGMIQWTAWLNIITCVLVLFQIIQLTVTGIQSHRLNGMVQGGGEVVTSEAMGLSTGNPIDRPDIYYIILDTYTRQDAFKAVLDYDNSDFIDGLRSRGFYIADCSLSNYNSTSASLTASLEMLYLDQLKPALQKEYRNLIFLDPYLQNNRVIASLEQVGYTTIAFESGYSPTELLTADRYLTRDAGLPGLMTGGLTRYESLLLQSSAGLLVYEFEDRLPPAVHYFLDATYVAHRQRILFELDRLGALQDIPAPKFVFAHLLAPHTPFVFTQEGQPVERNSPFTLNDDPELGDRGLYRQRFIDQTIYINAQVLQLVDRILAQAGDPVIILQGDHGVPSSGAWASAILNAIHLPGGEDSLYPSLTPVNTFRLVFNHLFSTNLPLAMDRSCRFNRSDPASCILIEEPSLFCESNN